MTARELIKALQDLGEENLDKQVLISDDEFGYVIIGNVKIIEEPDYKGYFWEPFIGID